MKKITTLLIIVCIIYGCKKDNTPGNGFDSFPGALDSIVRYSNFADSAVYSNPPNTWQLTSYFLYDEQHRVVSIKQTPTYYRLFYYQGNNKLPFLQIDSLISDFTSSTNYHFAIYAHFLTYNNLNKVTVDSTLNYTRYRDNALFPEYVLYHTPYVIKYYFQSNYSIFTDTRNIPSSNLRDTTFFNAVGDVLSLNFLGQSSGYGPFQHKVLDYYTIKTPMSDLNIAPLSESLGQSIFGDAVQNLYLNAFQPKSLFKKLSGTNPYYYTFNKNDLVEVFFYPKTDANNRITHLVIVNYRHRLNSMGMIDHTIKFYCNYRFFYHD